MLRVDVYGERRRLDALWNYGRPFDRQPHHQAARGSSRLFNHQQHSTNPRSQLKETLLGDTGCLR